MKSARCLSAILVVSFLLAACQSASQNSSPTSAPTGTSAVTGAATSAPQSTAATTPSTSGPAPVSTGYPAQSNAAAIRPPDQRPALTRLSNLLHFQVQGLNGAQLGQVSDFIINTCETYIVYLVLDPAPSLGVAAGQHLVLPFEAVTINSGALDAQAKAIVIQLAPDSFKAAPPFPNPLQLYPASHWEDPVRSYWQKVVRVGKLSSVCNASSGTTQKIAYATQLIGVPLQDANHNPLGSVQEAILEPESGKLGYYVINLQNNQGLVLVPLGKTNVPDDALKPGTNIQLVLLADSARLAGAPKLVSPDQASDPATQSAARQYWGQ